MSVATDTLNFDGVEVTVREMTVGEMRKWWADQEAREQASDKAADGDTSDVFEHLLGGQKLPLSDLRRMCSLKPEEMDRLSQGELGQLEAACEKLNPRFFALRQKLTRTVEQLLPSSAS